MASEGNLGYLGMLFASLVTYKPLTEEDEEAERNEKHVVGGRKFL